MKKSHISISVVSHGHINQVCSLINLLAKTSSQSIKRVWITCNTPEEQIYLKNIPFGVHWLHNKSPKGFGVNHNQAFNHDMGMPDPAPYFAVLNPDLEWSQDPFNTMLDVIDAEGLALVCPRQYNQQGQVQDHLRKIPTPGTLVSRYFSAEKSKIDAPDWVNAACLVFRSSVYKSIKGFDESYHMYCEDVDLCLRLQIAGYKWKEVPEASIVHLAQRNSHRNLRHLGWHIKSLLHLWNSAAYQTYKSRPPG